LGLSKNVKVKIKNNLYQSLLIKLIKARPYNAIHAVSIFSTPPPKAIADSFGMAFRCIKVGVHFNLYPSSSISFPSINKKSHRFG